MSGRPLLKHGYFGFLGGSTGISTIHPGLQAVALERENLNVLTPMLSKTLTTPSI
jgi:hypothetical protein